VEEKILVLGVGNILQTDEGIGVRAVQRLQERYFFPDNVRLVDGGTLGMGLMSELMDCGRVYVLDAVLGGGEPGSLYRLEGDSLRKSMGFRDSMHQTDLLDTLTYCELAGTRPQAVVFGMQPADYRTLGADLSPVVRERLPLLCDLLLEELRKRGVNATEQACRGNGQTGN
jgi:hydrogenase maturation protease